MLRLIVVWLFGFMCVACDNPAAATPEHGSTVLASSAACPYGSVYSDGCAGSTGTVRYTDLLTNSSYGPGTGQTLKHLQPFNVPGLDYAVGIQSGVTLTDPAISQPSGCTYNATGSGPGGPILVCQSTANLTINGYNFGMVGGHDCTILDLKTSLTGTVTITNDNFANCTNTNSAEPNPFNQPAIYAENGSTFNLVFSHNTMNGKCHTSRCTLTNFYGLGLNTTGSITERYNAIEWMPQRPETINITTRTSVGTLDVEYNLFLGFSYIGGAHGEIIEQILTDHNKIVTQAHTYYKFNTVVLPNTVLGGGTTALIYVQGGASNATGSPIYSDVQLVGNTLISNKNGRKPAAYSLVNFGNGTYTNVTIEDNFLNGPDAAHWQCYGSQATFMGVIDASGVLTVTGWAGHTIITGQRLWYSGHDSGFTIGSQLSGTAGQNGTYQTTASGAVSTVGMHSYYNPGDGIIKAVTMTGNQDLASGASINSFDGNYHCTVPLPD